MSPIHLLRVGALGVSFAFVALAPASAEVLATVDGKQITDEDLKIAAQDIGEGIPQQLQGKARDAYLLDYLIDGTLVAQKAEAEKLDQDPGFAKKLAYYHDKILIDTLMAQIAEKAVTPENMQKTYDEAAKAQKPETEIHARHILVATEAEAQAALKRIKAGEDFAKVAKEVSKDAASDGGDLGWFTKDRMVPAFADAAFKLNEGEVSEPVKSQFGWHIIKVEGKRQKAFPPFDQVKDQVQRYVIQRAQANFIESLHKDAKIEKTAAAPSLTPPSNAGGQQGAASPSSPTPAPASNASTPDKK